MATNATRAIQTHWYQSQGLLRATEIAGSSHTILSPVLSLRRRPWWVPWEAEAAKHHDRLQAVLQLQNHIAREKQNVRSRRAASKASNRPTPLGQSWVTAQGFIPTHSITLARGPSSPHHNSGAIV